MKKRDLKVTSIFIMKFMPSHGYEAKVGNNVYDFHSGALFLIIDFYYFTKP